MRYYYLLFFFTILIVAHNVIAQTASPFTRLNASDHPLVGYAPKQLIMVGTISQNDNLLGIVKTPDNHVYTVKPGSQLGNRSYVVDVTTNKITVQQNTQMIELPLRQVK